MDGLPKELFIECLKEKKITLKKINIKSMMIST